jgi:hypothetical protein
VEDVDDVVLRSRAASDRWILPGARRQWDGWPILHCALLRDLAGSTYEEAGSRAGVSAHAASRAYAHHRRFVRELPEYAGRAAALATEAIARCHAAVRAAIT